MNTGKHPRIKIVLAVVGGLALVALAAVFVVRQTGGIAPSRLTILVTGSTLGFLENCGCSGGQSGGVHRRATMIRAKRAEVSQPIVSDAGHPSESLTIDTGDFSDPLDPRQKLRSKGIVVGMKMIGYDSVGLGQNELGFNQEELYDLLTQNKPEFTKSSAELPYTCANLKFVKPTDSKDFSDKLAALVKPYRVITLKGGFRVGIIHVLDNSGIIRGEPIKTGYTVNDPIESATDILAHHRREARLWILSVGSNEQFGLRNEKVAELKDLTVVFGMRGYQPDEAAGSQAAQFPYFIDQPMQKGKDVTVTTLSFGDQNRIVVTAIKVGIREDNYKKADDIAEMIAAMKPEEEQLEQQLVPKTDMALDVPKYVGHTTCANCHRDIAEELASTKHMEAYHTLKVQDKQWTSCARCHNNGFNQPGGFNVIDDRRITGDWIMRNVQCENCHGAGEYHVKLHQNKVKSPYLDKDGRDKEGLVAVTSFSCEKCHNHENSPNFDFNKYWPYIQHGKPGLKPKPGDPPGAGMATTGHGESAPISPSASAEQPGHGSLASQVMALL